MNRVVHATATDPGQQFVDGNPAQGVPATVVPADWLNMIQEELVNVVEGGGQILDNEDRSQLLTAIQAIAANQTSIETDYIAGAAMTPATTSGAASEIIETTTNKQDFAVMTFAGDADSVAEFSYPMPENWNLGDIKAKLFWLPEAGSSAGDDVEFTLQAVALSEGESLDIAFPGVGVTITDESLGSEVKHLSPASAALTVEGDPALGDLVHFRLTRDVSEGATPMAEGCRVLGIWIQYTCNQAVTGW